MSTRRHHRKSAKGTRKSMGKLKKLLKRVKASSLKAKAQAQQAAQAQAQAQQAAQALAQAGGFGREGEFGDHDWFNR